MNENERECSDISCRKGMIEESYANYNCRKIPRIQYDNSISKSENLKKIFNYIIDLLLYYYDNNEKQKITKMLYNCEFNNIYDIIKNIDSIVNNYYINGIALTARVITSIAIKIFIAERLKILPDCQTGKIINNIYFKCFNNIFVLKYTIKTKNEDIQEYRLEINLYDNNIYKLIEEKINLKVLKNIDEFINKRIIDWWSINLPKIQIE